MKRILRLLRYVVVLGIILYAASQLYQPSTAVMAGACCNSDAQCPLGANGEPGRCFAPTDFCSVAGYLGTCGDITP